MSPRRLLLLVLLALVPKVSVRAAFVFDNVADTSSTSQFAQVTTPSVSVDGTVVFQGTLKSGVSGIYAYKAGQLTTVADTTQGYSSFTTIPAVNAHGDVAFAAVRDGASAVYKYRGGVVTKVLPGAGSSPSINDAGLVAVGTTVTDGTTPRDYAPGYSSVTLTSVINNNGVLGFHASTPSGYFLSDGSHVTQALPDMALGFLAMNNANVIAVASATQITTGNGTTTSTVATVSPSSPHDGFTAFFDQSAPPINDDGIVAFHPYSGLSSSPRTEALVLGSQWQRVIGTGDPLFGSTIVTGQGTELFSGFGLGTARMSFVGDNLAFRYYLASGVQGIALAHVPEPAALLPLLGLIPILRRPRR